MKKISYALIIRVIELVITNEINDTTKLHFQSEMSSERRPLGKKKDHAHIGRVIILMLAGDVKNTAKLSWSPAESRTPITALIQLSRLIIEVRRWVFH